MSYASLYLKETGNYLEDASCENCMAYPIAEPIVQRHAKSQRIYAVCPDPICVEMHATIPVVQ